MEVIRMSRRRGKEPQGDPSTGSREGRNPRFDEIMETSHQFGHMMGMQAWEGPTTYAQATESVVIAGNGGACQPILGLGDFTL